MFDDYVVDKINSCLRWKWGFHPNLPRQPYPDNWSTTSSFTPPSTSLPPLAATWTGAIRNIQTSLCSWKVLGTGISALVVSSLNVGNWYQWILKYNFSDFVRVIIHNLGHFNNQLLTWRMNACFHQASTNIWNNNGGTDGFIRCLKLLFYSPVIAGIVNLEFAGSGCRMFVVFPNLRTDHEQQ